MKKGDVVYHKVHGLMEVKRNKYQRLGNKNVFFGTDESGKEHEIDDSVESPEKYLKEKEKKESPKMMESMAELLSSIQGPQGEKGLDSDEESIIEKVLERIELPKDGKDGADADIELVARELLPNVLEKMPKPEKVNESSIVEKLMMRIKIPQDGKVGEKGKDGSPDTPKEIKGKLETLTGDERLDASAIKNLPKPIIGGGQSYTGLVKVDSTGTPGTLEDKLIAGSNITLTKTNDTIRIASSGGVGGGSVDSVVAGNNIDVDATDPANPVVSVETLTLADISDVTASVTEINYVDGVTSAIQTQLNGKASSLGVDDNYVTDAQLVVIGNTSGTNTGDNATNTQYSGLAASKQDTLVSGTNIKTINSNSLLGSGDIAVSAAPGGADTQVQFNDGGELGGDAGLTYNSAALLLLLSSAAAAPYFRVKGVNDGDNFGALELWNGDDSKKWQFAHANDGNFIFNHFASAAWTQPFAITDGNLIKLGITSGNSSAYYLHQNSDQLLTLQRDGGNPTGSEDAWTLLEIKAPDAPSSGDQEATLALTRDLGGGDIEFLDIYNNGYSSETQHGIRIQKRGSGAFQDFVIDRYDGSTKTPILKWDAGDDNLVAGVPLEVPNEAYDATDWNGSTEAPTKDAVRDQIEAEPSTTRILTNKRITKRTGTTTSSATPTINTDNVDFYSLTAQAADITSFTTNLSGMPTEGQTLWIAITGTAARAITWGASFEASTVALPTTTVSTDRLDVGFVWNSATSKWRCVATC